jgi:hypothetical protein
MEGGGLIRVAAFLLRGAGELEADMLAAVEQMPEDWDKTELQRFLVRRAELFTRTTDRLRRKVNEHAVRSRRL